MSSHSNILHGVDIVEIDRIRRVIKRWGEHFLTRIYTSSELNYSFRFKDPYPHLAVRFAAKEAGIKAISSVMKCYISDFEVVRENENPPFIKMLKPPYFRGFLSISHTGKLALASVIFKWRQDENSGA